MMSGDSTHSAVPSSDTSTSMPLAGALALEERGGDAAGDRHAADEVAERRPLLERRLAGGGQAIGDAAARPERDAVVAAAARVGAAASLAVIRGRRSVAG